MTCSITIVRYFTYLFYTDYSISSSYSLVLFNRLGFKLDLVLAPCVGVLAVVGLPALLEAGVCLCAAAGGVVLPLPPFPQAKITFPSYEPT